jgi:hypothetical protein
MLGATDFYPTTQVLEIVLWIEAVVYLGIGIYEVFDDFIAKPPPWTQINGETNVYVLMQHKVGHKMHAAICFLLGFVALNGALEGSVTRFEIELIFLSFALITGVIWAILPPGRMGLWVAIFKPEIWLQVVMYLNFADLIRPWVIGLCVLLNLWGVAVLFGHTRRSVLIPYTYKNFREQAAAVESADKIQLFDKLAGYQQEDSLERQSDG